MNVTFKSLHEKVMNEKCPPPDMDEIILILLVAVRTISWWPLCIYNFKSKPFILLACKISYFN